MKDSIKDLKGDGGTPFGLLPNEATLFRGFQFHWHMLLQLFAAFLLMEAYVHLDLWTDAGVPGGQSGILVTLFLMMGKSVLPKDLAIVSPARPVDEVPYFSMG